MDPLDRLYWRLVQALGGTPAARPVTVGEVYQSLVPYRAVRGELGLLELAEYEHTLLRLLAGEHGHLRADDPAVQEELLRELQSPNPILGLYRDYADATLHVAEPRRAEPLPAVPPAVARTPAPQPPAPSGAAQVAPLVAGAESVACHRCAATLPRGRAARFCPFCGSAQPAPCSACREAMDAAWSFCLACGEPRRRGVQAG